MKKLKIQTIVKILAILLVAMTVLTYAAPVFATELGSEEVITKVADEDGATGKKDDKKDDKKTTTDPSDPSGIEVKGSELPTDVKNKIEKILGTIKVVAAILAVAVIMFIGIKYILGSVEEKAEYKKTFMPLIIGVIFVVAATQIASWVWNLAT